MYIKSYSKQGKTTLKSNIDFMIYAKSQDKWCDYVNSHNITIMMCSLCDIAINVRGVINNFNSIDSEKNISMISYKNIHKQYAINDTYRRDNDDCSWKYKIAKNNTYTHGIIYNKKHIDNCVIDYDGNKKFEVLAKHINTKHHIPVTSEILRKLTQNEKYEQYKFFNELQVYSKDSTNIKAYYITDSNIKSLHYLLQNTDLGMVNESERWTNVNTVNDYILEFNKEIQEVLHKNIKVRFNQETDIPDMRMFEYKRKPYKGQIPLIESVKRTLMDEKRAIITAEMSCGKTTIGTMANDLYMQEKNKNNYITLVVAPNATLKKWSKEIKNILGKKVDVQICKSTVDYIRLMNKHEYKQPLYIITSKETAKLGFKRRPAVNYSTRIVNIDEIDSTGKYVIGHFKEKIKDLALCPKCGMPMINKAKKKDCNVEDEYLREYHFNTIKKSNYKCPNCDEVLWTVDYKKTKKTSLMDYCHRKNVTFDSVIFDEFHGEKGLNSATAMAFGQILKMSKIKILLSGTMNNGNVSSIFPLFMRLIPYKMFKDGYTLKDMDKFIKTYGSLKAIKNIKDDEQKMSTRTIFKDSDFSEVAGINAIVYTKYLADITISATIDDLGVDMVDYKEYPVPVQMEEDFQNKYINLTTKLKSSIPYNFEMYNSTVIRHYVNNPFQWSNMKVTKYISGEPQEVTINFPNLDENIILNKEKILLELINTKLKEGRKCLVFTDFTGGHSKYQKGTTIDNRLMTILKDNNINTKTLKSSVKPMERMDYINKYSDTDVWITNPILVKEGLDLIDYPIIIFYNCDYQILNIQQASRRAWRTIQTVDCETYYFYYENTVEEKIIKSNTLKKLEMSAIEGKFNIDDFNMVKRTASSLGKELYDCINISDSMDKMNLYQVKSKNIKLHPEVEKLYKK